MYMKKKETHPINTSHYKILLGSDLLKSRLDNILFNIDAASKHGKGHLAYNFN